VSIDAGSMGVLPGWKRSRAAKGLARKLPKPDQDPPFFPSGVTRSRAATFCGPTG
jgi:hypothetical protein